MKNIQSPFANLDPIAIFGTKTKIKVQLTSGGRIWLDNVPNGSVQIELLKRKIGMSQVRGFERVQVPAR